MNFIRYSRLILGLFLAIYSQLAMGMTDNTKEFDSLISFPTDDHVQNLPQEDQIYISEHTLRLEAEKKRLEQIEEVGRQRQQEIQTLTFAKADPQAFHKLITQPIHQRIAQQQLMHAPVQIAQSQAQPQPINVAVPVVGEQKKDIAKIPSKNCVVCWANNTDIPYTDLLTLQDQGFKISCEDCKAKALKIICHGKRCGVALKVSPDTLKITLKALANEQPPRTQDQLMCTDFGYECSLHLTCKTCGSLFSIPKKYQPEFLTHQERENFTCAFITWENMSNREQEQRNQCPLIKPTQKKKKTKKS